MYYACRNNTKIVTASTVSVIQKAKAKDTCYVVVKTVNVKWLLKQMSLKCCLKAAIDGLSQVITNLMNVLHCLDQ